MTRTLSQTDIEVLALLSGDVDPFYVAGNGSGFGHRESSTIEAAGAEALIAGVLGTKLPGPGMKILHGSLRFCGQTSVGDQLTATVKARAKRAEGTEVDFDCRCVNQAGDELVTGTVTVAAPTHRVTYGEVAPPELVLRRGDSFGPLFKACESLPAVSCAVVHPCDRDSLLGPIESARRGLIVPVLVGPEAKIKAVATAEGVDLSPYQIVPVAHSNEAAMKAVEMARAGEVESLMKGSLHTDELLGAVVPSAAGLRTKRRISHVFVMDGQLEGLFTAPRSIARNESGEVVGEKQWDAGTQLGHRGAIDFLFEWWRHGALRGNQIVAAGHRVRMVVVNSRNQCRSMAMFWPHWTS